MQQCRASGTLFGRNGTVARLAAEASGDPTRVDGLKTEEAWLTRELRRAKSLGGRTRPMPSPEERSRIAVTKAIGRVVRDLKSEHPHLGVHLDNAIHTGFRCSYRPEVAVHWTV